MRTVVIVRPRHPLEGEPLPMLGRMRRHGRLELLLVLPDGSKSLIPAEWTDLEEAPASSGPATVGTVADLQQAVAVAAALLPGDEQQMVQATRHPLSEEDDRAACTDEFAAGPDAGATPGAVDPAPRGTGRGRARPAGPSDRQRRRGGQQLGGGR